MTIDQWKTERLLEEGCLRTVTTKITIDEEVWSKDAKYVERYDRFSLYLIRGNVDGRLTYIDIRPNGLHAHNVRAMMECVCFQARKLLQTGTWGESDLIDAWAGRQFRPRGTCEQCKSDENHFGAVSSPLDAIAKYLRLQSA